MIQEAEFTEAHYSTRARQPHSSDVRPAVIALPALIFLVCFTIAITHAMQHGGFDMWAGYGFGFLFQLLFGCVAALAAAELQPRTLRPWWLAAVRIAAIFVLFDAAHIWLSEYPLIEFIAMSIISIILLCGMFGWRGVRGVILAMLIFMMKIIGSVVITNTWYTWF